MWVLLEVIGIFKVGSNVFCIMRYLVIYGDKSGRWWFSGLLGWWGIGLWCLILIFNLIRFKFI